MNKWARPFDTGQASASPAGPALTPVSHHYFAFLSYSHSDVAEADWIHRELERFLIPSSLAGRLTANGVIPRRLTPIFRDCHELAAGDDLSEEINEALAASRCLIVLCSPAAAASKWTNAEIAAFKRMHPDGCVVAAIVAGEPFASRIPGREDEECFPPALTQRYDRRGRATGKEAEPLAADLREGRDGRRLGILKIVAGILGVGLDDLVQREHLRRQRRLAGITAASLGGMLVASVLAVTAIEARDAARDQRREAEGLVEFMVGDLREKLEPMGRLDVLDGLGSRVLEYYSKQDTSELSDQGLAQRSRALELTAQVAFSSGDLDKAERLYRQAMAGTDELVRRDPEDLRRLFDHAQNVFWIGEVARYRGEPAQAAAGYREYRRLAYLLAEGDPDNLKYRMEVLYGEENVGISLYNQRRYAEAAGQFATVLESMEKLASLYPANSTYQNEVANVQGWVAEARRAEGNFDSAIAARERQLALLNGLLSREAADVDLRRQAMIANMALGILLGERGRAELGAQHLRLAVTEAERLIGVEPRNAIWKTIAANAHLELAKSLLSLRRQDDAGREARAGCALAAGLKTNGAGIQRVRVVQTECLMVQSRLALAGGATAPAVESAERALASARSERNEDPVTDRYRVAAAFLLLGDVRKRTSDDRGAVAAWTAGLAQLPPGVAERPLDMNVHAELLRRLGRAGEAGRLAARLAAIEYRSVT